MPSLPMYRGRSEVNGGNPCLCGQQEVVANRVFLDLDLDFDLD